MATQGWWDANYRNGFWSVEAQEEKVAALKRQVCVMWGMVDVRGAWFLIAVCDRWVSALRRGDAIQESRERHVESVNQLRNERGVRDIKGHKKKSGRKGRRTDRRGALLCWQVETMRGKLVVKKMLRRYKSEREDVRKMLRQLNLLPLPLPLPLLLPLLLLLLLPSSSYSFSFSFSYSSYSSCFSSSSSSFRPPPECETPTCSSAGGLGRRPLQKKQPTKGG